MEKKMNEAKDYCIKALDFTKDWDTWTDTLKQAITAGKGYGVSDEEIKEIALRLGDFLAEKVCPETKEEELIRKMWTAASVDERKTLVSIFFKMLEAD